MYQINLDIPKKKKLLDTATNPNLISIITTHQGSELVKSPNFSTTIDKYGYILTPTDASTSAQNSMSEKN